MKHRYTKEQIQAAIDAACNATASSTHRPNVALLSLVESDTTDDWQEETPARLHLAEKLLELLPETPQLSTLRPIAEAGEVPDGCVRVSGWLEDHGWYVSPGDCDQDTHFADIRIPVFPIDTLAQDQIELTDEQHSAVDAALNEAIHEGGEVFQVGDVVTLKSGGPKMTLTEIVGDIAHCQYFIGASLLAVTVPSSTLLKV